MEKITTTTVYLPVDLSERMPPVKGWYNLTSNACPEPCGRAYFNGKQFNYTISAAVHGILESGGKLFWLEKKEEMVYMSKEEAIKLAGEIFDAGVERGDANCEFGGNSIVPDKITFINNLFK